MCESSCWTVPQDPGQLCSVLCAELSDETGWEPQILPWKVAYSGLQVDWLPVSFWCFCVLPVPGLVPNLSFPLWARYSWKLVGMLHFFKETFEILSYSSAWLVISSSGRARIRLYIWGSVRKMNNMTHPIRAHRLGFRPGRDHWYWFAQYSHEFTGSRHWL